MCVLVPEFKVDGNMNLFLRLISTLQPTLVPGKLNQGWFYVFIFMQKQILKGLQTGASSKEDTLISLLFLHKPLSSEALTALYAFSGCQKASSALEGGANYCHICFLINAVCYSITGSSCHGDYALHRLLGHTVIAYINTSCITLSTGKSSTFDLKVFLLDAFC